MRDSETAVLVAIAIPVFTSQLEKSREATDISNIRSAYAEVVTAILTGDLDGDLNNVKVANDLTVTGKVNHSAAFVITVNNLPMQQKQAKWITANPQIAGVDIATGEIDSYTVATTKNLYLKFKIAADGDILLDRRYCRWQDRCCCRCSWRCTRWGGCTATLHRCRR